MSCRPVVIGLVLCLWLPGFPPAVWAGSKLSVRIEGVTGAVLRNLEAHLAIRALATRAPSLLELAGRNGNSPDVTVAEVRRRHARAEDDIRSALQALGYYHGVVDGTLTANGEGWSAVYRIERGPATKWRTVHLELTGEAQADVQLAERLVALLPAVGKRVHHGTYDAARDRAIEILTSSGYVDASYRRAELRVYPASRMAELDWLIDSGPRHTFGEVRVDQAVLDPALVARYIDVQPGEPFDAARLANLQLRLVASGYFSDVDVHVDREAGQDGQIPVRLDAAPARSRFYRAGLGYGTDTGPRLTLGTEFRRLNRSGHRLRLDLRAATVRSSAGVEYLVPWRDVTRDVTRFYGQIDRGDIGDAESDQYSFGVRFEDGWRFGLRRATYLQFSHDSFQFQREPARQADLLIAGVTLALQQGDDLLFTRKGFSATVDVHGGQGDLASDTSFVHATARGTLVLPVNARSRLILRGGLGLVEAEDFLALPPSQRFFTGGDRTLRGYAFESISARDQAGIDIGGSRFFNQTVELDTLLWRDFGVATFYDQGGAGRTFFGVRKQSVGVGFRWRSPVGFLRVDVAHPLDGSGGVRFHLGLGPDL